MKFFKKHSLVLSLALIAVLLFSASLLQKKYDDIVHPQILFTTETRYVLPAHIVSMFSFGFKNVIADLYWVKAIQDFAIWDGMDPFYAQEYRNIATLDPKFPYPYLLGILTFTSKGKREVLEQIEPVTQIGIRELPNEWEIPFYLGTGFQLVKTPEKALPYLKISSEISDAPDQIKRAYKNYLKQTLTGTKPSGEINNDLIKTIYDNTKSETTKKIIEDGVMVNTLTEIIQTLVKKYRTLYGEYPQSIDLLAEKKMIQLAPLLKEKFTITINQNTGAVTVTPKKSIK